MREPMDLRTRKDSLRRVVLARRRAPDPEQRAAAAAAVSERLFSLSEAAGARTILAFASTGTEISTDAIVERALAEGRAVLLPYVAGPGDLRAAPIRTVEDLAPGYRGIREPARRVPVDPGTAGVVLVPGVAFDAGGRRLGYGGGFYDRFLAAVPRRVPRIGLAFDLQIVDAVPEGEGDERVDAVVTEERVLRAP